MNVLKTIIFICVVLYLLSMLFILMYSLAQGYLAWSYLTKGKKQPVQKIPNCSEYSWPDVTIQLPVYNEKYVVVRLIDAVVKMDYPKDKLEIQILDDSTDETVDIIARKVEEYFLQGFNIKQVCRKNREGYKAGALKVGLNRAEGEYIAIFDADFIPQPDFLKKTIPHFHHEKTGMVQTRWGHLNRSYSLLTRMQAFALDAHFGIEQKGRNASGCFMNFNGTAGVWRKSCILDAGNWQSDTLSEDMDLSYRAQLKGWKFIYLEDVISPAELPPVMSAVKTQQYRWTKGGAQTARKLLWQVLRSKQSLKVKWQATFHLLNTLVFPAIICSAICSVPLLLMPGELPVLSHYIIWASVFFLSFLIFGLIYYVTATQTAENRLGYFIRIFPLFLSVYMGLSLHNSLAVLSGWWGKQTPFIRTPKFDIPEKEYGKKLLINNSYLKNNIPLSTWMEGILTLYFFFGVIFAFYLNNYSLILFHLMLVLGFGLVFYYSIRRYPLQKRYVSTNSKVKSTVVVS